MNISANTGLHPVPSGAAAPAVGSGADLRVLLVSERAGERQLLEAALRTHGFQTFFGVATGLDAVARLLCDERWDVSFALPSIPGCRVSDLRSQFSALGLDIPLILLQRSPDENAAATGLDQGAEDCVILGVWERLGAVVRRCLRHARDRQAWRESVRHLREREELFDAVGSHAAVGIALINPETLRFEEFNEEACRAHGYTRTEFARLGLADLETESPPERIVERLRSVLAQGAAEFESRHRTRNGGWRDFRVHQRVVMLRGQRLVSAVWHDTTEAHRMEVEVRRSESRFRSYMETAPVAVFVVDRVGRFIEYNAAALDLLGCDATAIRGLGFADVAAVEDVDALRHEIHRLVEGGRVEGEYRLVRQDGRIVWVSLRAVKLAVDRYLAFCPDITERRRLEDEMAHSISLLQATIECSTDGLLVVDREGRVTAWNRRFVELWRLPESILAQRDDNALLAQVLSQLLDPEAFLRDVRRLYAQADAEDLRVLRFKDGRLYERYSRPQLLGDRTVGRVWSFRDVTERERAEAALQENLLFLRQTESIARIGGWKWIIGTDELIATDGARAILELRPEQLPGLEDALKYFVPEDAETLAAALRRGEPFALEAQLQSAGGTRLWTEIRGTPMLGDHRGPAIVGTFQDITSRRQAEQALRESEQNLSIAQAVAHMGSWHMDVAAGTLEWSAETYRVFGVTPGERMTRTQFMNLVHPEDRETVRSAWEAAVAGAPYEVEHRILAEGSVKWVHERARLEFDRHGTLVGAIGTSQDITHQKLTEAQRQNLEAQLRQAQKMDAIGQLSGGVAHDINNILTIINGNVSLMVTDDRLPPDLHDLLNEITKSSARAANLTRQLLTFSRRQALKRQDVDLNEVVTDISRMLRRVIAENIDLQLALAPGALGISADVGMLEQVLLNLALNARDAMPRGGRLVLATSTLEIAAGEEPLPTPQARPGSFVRLAVTDTGTGIPQDHLPRLFEPFFTTKAVGKGTGLGLATVYGIVNQHQGWISVHSELGSGTRFDIHLPRLHRALPVRAEPPPSEAVPHGTETLLLVEDEAPLRQLVRTHLTRAGYRVLEAPSGHAALAVWERHRGEINLVLSDQVMPEGMTGFEMIMKLRAEQPGLKAIIASGYSPEIMGGLLELHPEIKFVSKPFAPDDLVRLVRATLDGAN